METHIPQVGIVHGNDPFDWFGVWLPDEKLQTREQMLNALSATTTTPATEQVGEGDVRHVTAEESALLYRVLLKSVKIVAPTTPENTPTTPEHAARKWLDTTEGGNTRQDIASGGSMTEGLIKAFQAGADWRGEKEGK